MHAGYLLLHDLQQRFFIQTLFFLHSSLIAKAGHFFNWSLHAFNILNQLVSMEISQGFGI
mgnify:CR=1 FL=1